VKLLPALFLALLLAGCGKQAADEAPADPVVTVHAQAVTERSFRDEVEAPGRWKSASQLSVRSPAAGFVETLTPRPGDRIGTGQVVGRVLTRESRAALEGAQLMAREAHSAAARAEANRALALARRELVRVPLVAGHGGVVLARAAEPGAQVDEGADVLVLVSPEGLVFEAHVPAAQGPRVRPGQTGLIIVDPEAPRPATVRTVLPMADSTDQSTVVWLVPASLVPPPALSRFGAARIATGAPRTSPAVPEIALVEDDLTGEPQIAVIDSSGRAIWTKITAGVAKDGWREILSPRIAAGTRVVTEGQHGLADSTRVEIAK
jgi:multidrug efflux pump subunit AcrA (membrane-fusion protein)